MNDLFGTLFDDGGLKVNPTEGPKEDSKMFRPRYTKGQNKKYEAVVRFLPNPTDPRNKSIISKWTVFLKDPRTQQGKEIDSPSTISEPCPMSQMYFALSKSSNPQAQKVSDDFKRNQRFFSLVQIIENNSEPQTVGKILVWSYGKKIFDKLQTEQTPVMQGMEPNQPFDLFKGRLFRVIAVEQSGFNNLDQSGFIDVPYPANCMRMLTTTTNNLGQPVQNVVPATKELAQTPEGRQAIFDYFTTNAPSLEPFEYKPWNEEQKNYVEEMIRVHSMILEGQPINIAQQNAAVSAMSMGQSNVPVQPTVSLGGLTNPVQTVQNPVQTTPSLGSILGTTPTIPTNEGVQTNSGVALQMPSTPVQTPNMGTAIPGLSMGGGFTETQPQTVPNMGGVSGLNLSGLDSVMGTTAPTVTTPTPTGNLGDIMGNIMG